MTLKTAATVPFSTRHSWNVFASSIFCMISSGTIYWFAALGQGLKSHLNFSDRDVTLVLAAVNGGSILGIIGGIVYKRAGSKRTTIIGATLTSLSYLSLALLVRYRTKNALLIVICLAVCIVTGSSIVYSASVATTAAIFPKAQRGRIMGLLASMYGMSSGVCGVLQAAFFPNVDCTEPLLYFIAFLTATPIIIAGFVFPDSTTVSVTETDPERTPLFAATTGYADGALNSTWGSPGDAGTEDRLIALTYAIAVAVVVDLQFGAFASWTNSVHISLPGVLADWAVTVGLPPILRAEVVSALFLVLLLFSFLLLPFGFRPSTLPQHNYASLQGEAEEAEITGLPFRDVVRDVRFHLMTTSFFILTGGSTVTTMVRSADIAASRMFPSFHNEAVPADFATANAIDGAVRALVVAFSACNMMARLVAGSIADMGASGKEREAWKLRLVQCDVVLMGLATLGVAFSSSWRLVVAVGLVGYAHGTFFAITPTQMSNWFGVDGFPLNFAILDAGVLLGTICFGSWLSSLVADYVMRGSWIEVAEGIANGATQRFCSGVWCYAPTFVTIALLNFVLAAVYGVLFRRILAASACSNVARS